MQSLETSDVILLHSAQVLTHLDIFQLLFHTWSYTKDDRERYEPDSPKREGDAVGSNKLT
jgi:hypothetical protein